jgi:putative DNA primase/helicase
MSTSRGPIDIDGLKSHIDPVKIIGAYVKLHRSGAQWVGCCPFHDDSSPSLSVSERGFRCFGCEAKGDAIRFVSDIEGITFLEAYNRLRFEAGFTPGEIRPNLRERVERAKKAPAAHNVSEKGKIVATYDYTDERGALLFQVVRLEPKNFYQRRPDPDKPGAWINKVREKNSDLVRHVLYRLPKIRNADTVIIACGEKDVHTLEGLGFTATTNPGGEGKWRPAYSETLRDKTVYLFPDNDEAGRRHAELLTRELANVAAAFYVCPVPRGKDVTEWEPDRVDVELAMEDARKRAGESYAAQERGEKLTPNDIGRMILESHALMRDMHGYSYEYNGRSWSPVTPDQVAAYANQIDTHQHSTRARRAEAADYALTQTHIREIPWRQIEPCEVPVLNGVASITTGEVRPHRKTDYLEFVVPHRWPGRQQCPTWESALRRYFGADADCEAKIAAMQEFFGYCLMPHARYKKAMLLHGESNTGKSMIPAVLSRLFGRKYVCSVSVDDMDDPRKREPLIGKALNILTELTAKSVVADGGFKTLVSTEEPILIDPKFKPPVLYTPTAKHVICTNNLPSIRDTSNAVYNRLLLIQFHSPIPESEQDMDFESKLAPEMEGILYWSMVGASRLYANGGRFTEIPESKYALEEYKLSQNPIYDFIAEKCVIDPDVPGIPTQEFREKYAAWLGDRVHPRQLAAQARAAGHEIRQVLDNGTRVRRVPNLYWKAQPGIF